MFIMQKKNLHAAVDERNIKGSRTYKRLYIRERKGALKGFPFNWLSPNYYLIQSPEQKTAN